MADGEPLEQSGTGWGIHGYSFGVCFCGSRNGLGTTTAVVSPLADRTVSLVPRSASSAGTSANPVWDIGFWPVIVGLVAYTVLPVLRNTMVGLQQVDPSIIEAARGMGMTRWAVLVRIELPLAVPIIMAGARTALVINVGTATLATFVGVSTLGAIIVAGTSASLHLVVIVGAAPTAVLALFIDYLAGIAEDKLRPRGL